MKIQINENENYEISLENYKEIDYPTLIGIIDRLKSISNLIAKTPNLNTNEILKISNLIAKTPKIYKTKKKYQYEFMRMPSMSYFLRNNPNKFKIMETLFNTSKTNRSGFKDTEIINAEKQLNQFLIDNGFSNFNRYSIAIYLAKERERRKRNVITN